jgi:hypothetical protein
MLLYRYAATYTCNAVPMYAAYCSSANVTLGNSAKRLVELMKLRSLITTTDCKIIALALLYLVTVWRGKVVSRKELRDCFIQIWDTFVFCSQMMESKTIRLGCCRSIKGNGDRIECTTAKKGRWKSWSSWIGDVAFGKDSQATTISFAVQIVDKFDDFHRWVNTISKF